MLLWLILLTLTNNLSSVGQINLINVRQVFMMSVSGSQSQEELSGFIGNPSHLAGQKKRALGAGAWQNQTLSIQNALFYYGGKLNNVKLAALIMKSGTAYFSDEVLSITVAKSFSDKLNLGTRFNVCRRAATGYRSSILYYADLGLSMEVNDRCHLGLVLMNPFYFLFGEKRTDSFLSSALTAGIAYEISDDCVIFLECNKMPRFPLEILGKLTYKPHKALSVGYAVTPIRLRHQLFVNLIGKKIAYRMSFSYQFATGLDSGILVSKTGEE